MNKNLLPLEVYGELVSSIQRLLGPVSLLGGLVFGLWTHFGSGDLSLGASILIGVVAFGLGFWFLFRPLSVRLCEAMIFREYSRNEEPQGETDERPYEYFLVCQRYRGAIRTLGSLGIGKSQVAFLPAKGQWGKDPQILGSPNSLTVNFSTPMSGLRALLLGPSGVIEVRSGTELHRFIVPQAEFAAEAVRKALIRLQS